MRALVAAVAAAIVCASGTASSGGSLHGIVLAGPTKPVCTAEEPCEKPVRVTLIFSHLVGRTEVRRTRSNSSGRYRITLPGGYYAVRTAERIGIQRNIRPRRVHVRAGHLDWIDFRIDTGIR